MRKHVRLQRDRHLLEPSSSRWNSREDASHARVPGPEQSGPSPSPDSAPSLARAFDFGAIDIASQEQISGVASGPLQRQTHVPVAPTMPHWEPGDALPMQRADLGSRIRAAQGGGSALQPQVRQRLERGLGADLSGVRVHTDGEADALSRSVQAVAFTTGPDIFFRSGAHNPHSSEGMHLLAHEATHTVQQAAGPVDGTPAPGGVSISDPGDRFERAAEGNAAEVAQLQRAPAIRTDSAGLHLQRSIHMEPRTLPGTSVNVQRNGLDAYLRQALRARRVAVHMASPEVEAEEAREFFATTGGARATAEAATVHATPLTIGQEVDLGSALGRRASATPEGLSYLLDEIFDIANEAERVAPRAALASQPSLLEARAVKAWANKATDATWERTPPDETQRTYFMALVMKGKVERARTALYTTAQSDTFSQQVRAGEVLGNPITVTGAGGTTPRQMVSNLSRAISGVSVTWALGGFQYNNADRNDGGGNLLVFNTNIRVPRQVTANGKTFRLSDHVIANMLKPRDDSHTITLEEISKALETRGTGDPRWTGNNRDFQSSKIKLVVGEDGTIVTAFYDSRLWDNSNLPQRYNAWLEEKRKAAAAARLKEAREHWNRDGIFEAFHKSVTGGKSQTKAAEEAGVPTGLRPDFYRDYKQWKTANRM